MRWLLAALAGSLLALLPAAAFAQTPEEEDGLILRVNGDVVIGADEAIASVVVINGDLTLDGRVTDFVLVIEGNAAVSGTVEGDVTVISGDIDLAETSVVDNVNVVRGDLVRAAGATVTGDINEEDDLGSFWLAAGIFSAVFWLAMTIAAIAAGIIFAIFGGRQLGAASRLMTGSLVNAIIGTVFLWIGVPILAVLAIITVVGIPLGIGMLVFLLPALAFLGYIVAGTRLGMFIVGLANRETGEHPILAASLGILVLQLIILIPALGALIGLIAALWGAGALLYLAYRNAGGKGFESGGSTQPSPTPESA